MSEHNVVFFQAKKNILGIMTISGEKRKISGEKRNISDEKTFQSKSRKKMKK